MLYRIFTWLFLIAAYGIAVLCIANYEGLWRLFDVSHTFEYIGVAVVLAFVSAGIDKLGKIRESKKQEVR